MNVDLAKFLALTAMMSAPLVAACDLTNTDGEEEEGGGEGATSTAEGGSDTTGGATDEGDGEGEGSGTAGGSTGGADSTGAADSTGGGTFEGECCDPNGTPGCNDPDISACVCGIDEVCCMDEVGWDQTCVDIAANMCEAGCALPVCCDEVAFPGCEEDPVLEACVCKIDAYCCGDMDGVWDSTCVQIANESCDAGCPALE